MRMTFDRVVNIAVLAACVAVILMTMRVERATGTRSVARPPAYQKGDRIGKVAGLTLDGVDRTLILGIRSDCPYCAASLPFYQRLLAECSHTDSSHIRIVVITSDDRATADRYLQDHQLSVAQVIPSVRASNELRLLSTPTLVLTDPSRTVNGVWIGQLGPEGEQEVIASACVVSHKL
jgi:hypothetical protein